MKHLDFIVFIYWYFVLKRAGEIKKQDGDLRNLKEEVSLKSNKRYVTFFLSIFLRGFILLKIGYSGYEGEKKNCRITERIG